MQLDHHFVFDHFSIKYPGADFLYQNFSLSIPKNRWLAILGPSGIGKSTLLHAISKQFHTKYAEVSISLLPQNITLLPWMCNLDNVLLGDLLRGKVSASCQIKARNLLEKVDLNGISHAKPKQLSGGERQRVIIARTMYEDSDIVLMDEPFSGLDAITTQEVQNYARQHFTGKTVVLVTHDPLEALRLCDQIIVLHGKPVSYHESLSLRSDAPRDIENNEVMQCYPILMQQLIEAKHQITEPI